MRDLQILDSASPYDHKGGLKEQCDQFLFYILPCQQMKLKAALRRDWTARTIFCWKDA